MLPNCHVAISKGRGGLESSVAERQAAPRDVSGRAAGCTVGEFFYSKCELVHSPRLISKRFCRG
jgi:hypothetical protein